jgi:PAS domain S-box-containing protein
VTHEPPRNPKSAKVLMAPIICFVLGILLLGFVFSIYVSVQYERHNAQLRFLDVVSGLTSVLRNQHEALFEAVPEGGGPVRLDAGDRLSGLAVLAAMTVTKGPLFLRITVDGETRAFYKGVSAAAAQAAAEAGDMASASAMLGWRDVHAIEDVAFDPGRGGLFSIAVRDESGGFVSDFVFNELRPFLIGTVAVGFLIAFGAYRFVQRRYEEVAYERARFGDFVEASSDWFWEMDGDLRFRYFSDRFTAVSGVPESRLLGRTREEDGNPGASPEDWERHLADLHAHRPFRNFVHPRVKADGTTVWLSINGVPIFENDRFAGYRGTGSDVTRQREIEEQLRSLREEAERANRAKSEFLAAMSHDLRTPLNAILGFADMIRSETFGELGPKYREYGEDIHASGEVLLNLVGEVLDLSAIESGRYAVEDDDVDFHKVAGDIRRMLAPRAEAAGVRLSARVDQGCDPFLTDERAVHQILQNLTANAVKFTPPGGMVGVTVTVKDATATLEIRDSGAGMSPDEVNRMLEPFSKGDPSPFVTEDGWGLGLSIVRSLVTLLGGRLDIRSALGRGTTVTVVLPRNAS